jgi:hypothetical protein
MPALNLKQPCEHWQGGMDTQDPALNTHSVQVLMHLQQERQDTTPERLYTGKLCRDETAPSDTGPKLLHKSISCQKSL